nr:DUF4091 domain-containing protein [Clostridia bacterium]
MNIRFGFRNESYKLMTANAWTFNPKAIDSFGTSLELTAGRGDWAAFQIVVWCDEDYALNVGNTAWFSQDIGLPTLRVAANCKNANVETELRIIDMHEDNDRIKKADALLTNTVLELKKNEVRAIWVEVKIPETATAYTCTLKPALYLSEFFRPEFKVAEGEVNIEILDYVMPKASEHKFHLDLWQHASNIARKHETPMWSDEHFAVLEQYIKSLGELGQKAVTLIVSEIPWSGQSCFLENRMAANLFEYSIVPISKTYNGKFSYDFTKMQRYIDICAKYGIDREISLYGLANIWTKADVGLGQVAPDYPDGIRLRYFDEGDGCYKYMTKASEIDAYIKALEQYFITTGQMDKVRLAADEPGNIEAYRKSLGHIFEIAPSFKCKAAINHAEFIPEFGNEVYDFAPSLGSLSKEYDKMMEYKRTMAGKRFLWYVCCGPLYPNTFLRSDLCESYFIGVLTSYANLDGFLRWNYTVWNDDPRADIRYGNWQAGDINFVYPAYNGAPLLTLRYKALKRGIELYELLEKLKETGDNEAVEEAFNYVVREKDIRTYYETPHKLEDMCSLSYADYMAMKRFIIEKLSAK